MSCVYIIIGYHQLWWTFLCGSLVFFLFCQCILLLLIYFWRLKYLIWSDEFHFDWQMSEIYVDFECGMKHIQQKAQLSQRPRDDSIVSLNILLRHSSSLKVIRNDTLEQEICKSLLVCHCNYVCISYHFWDSQCQITAWPWNLGFKSYIICCSATTDDFRWPWWISLLQHTYLNPVSVNTTVCVQALAFFFLHSEHTPLKHCCVHNMSPFVSSSGLSPGSREAKVQRAKVCLKLH